MKDLYVSKTRLPPLSKYNKYLKVLWKSRYLTNNGIFVQELENRLKKYWKVKHVICVSSGTSATEIALKAMGIKKEIYVSPFSYVSTVSVPLWLGIKPLFVDIGEKYKGPAFVTHTYGLPHFTNVHPVLYDASHAFCVKVNGKSILSYGDCSIVSFHATKIFHSVEGGAIVTNSDDIAEKSRWMRNFGHDGQYKYFGVGINAKMSEFHAVMGLCSLDTIDQTEKRYDEIINMYNDKLSGYGENLSYYPFFYSTEKVLLKAIKIFEENHIYPRRYFYPALNTIFNGKKCPVAEDLSSRVLCLPLYYELTNADVQRVIKVTLQTL